MRIKRSIAVRHTLLDFMEEERRFPPEVRALVEAFRVHWDAAEAVGATPQEAKAYAIEALSAQVTDPVRQLIKIWAREPLMPTVQGPHRTSST